jgi:hypothetical protein
MSDGQHFSSSRSDYPRRGSGIDTTFVGVNQSSDANRILQHWRRRRRLKRRPRGKRLSRHLRQHLRGGRRLWRLRQISISLFPVSKPHEYISLTLQQLLSSFYKTPASKIYIKKEKKKKKKPLAHL